MSRVERALNIADIRRLARRRLPRAIFEVIEGGAGDEITLAANRADFDAIRLLPRSLQDVSQVDLTTTVVGQKMSMPVLLAPCSFGRMCNPEAERAVARAASTFGAGYIMPGGASESVEDVAAASSGPLWYQIYLSPDDAVNDDLLARVEASGFQALVVSVDTPMKPYRERDMRNGINLPLAITPRLMMAGVSRPRWSKDFVFGNMASGFSLTAARKAYYNFESAMSMLRAVTLDDVARLRERWRGPLIVKGLLSDDKIRELVDLGVDAVSVSNHGGRNLDGVSSAVAALPRVVDAAAGGLEVLVDGGIRRGVDVLRALALGATACLIGRPYMYGLAAGGQAGVERVLELMRNELHVAMAFTGSTAVDTIDRGILADRPTADITTLTAQLEDERISA